MMTLRGQAEVRRWVNVEMMMICNRAVVTENGDRSAHAVFEAQA
jgi:hypothetical protein